MRPRAALALLWAAGAASRQHPEVPIALRGQLGELVTVELPLPPSAEGGPARSVACLFGNTTVAARTWAINEARGTLKARCEVPSAPLSMWQHSAKPWVELTLTMSDDAGRVRIVRRVEEPPFLFEFLRSFPLKPAPYDVVPNVVHAVFVGGAPFPGYACLSLLCAALVWNPSKIYLHVDTLPPNDASWACAREFATVRVHGPLSAAEAASMPRIPLHRLLPQHRSDLLRARVLWEEGGVYLDADTYAMAPLGQLRRYEFTMAYEGSRYSSGKLNNGLMLGAPRARFGGALHRSYARWDGTGWDEQSCRVPFTLALEQPSAVHIENYPERRFADGGLAPPVIGIFGGRMAMDRRANLTEAFKGCIALHLSGMGSNHNTLKNRARKKRGYLHYMLANALARMTGPPASVSVLAARAAEGGARGVTAGVRLCRAVFAVRAWLRSHKDRLPPPSTLPAPSRFAPAECAHPASHGPEQPQLMPLRAQGSQSSIGDPLRGGRRRG